jgi:hypothetical protein
MSYPATEFLGAQSKRADVITRHHRATASGGVTAHKGELRWQFSGKSMTKILNAGRLEVGVLISKEREADFELYVK